MLPPPIPQPLTLQQHNPPPRLSVRRAIAFFLDNLQRQLEREETLGAIGEDLFAIALDSPFRFPVGWALGGWGGRRGVLTAWLWEGRRRRWVGCWLYLLRCLVGLLWLPSALLCVLVRSASDSMPLLNHNPSIQHNATPHQATFTFVLRAFSTLEGIGKTLVPTYRFSELAQPYASVRSGLRLGTCHVSAGCAVIIALAGCLLALSYPVPLFFTLQPPDQAKPTLHNSIVCRKTTSPNQPKTNPTTHPSTHHTHHTEPQPQELLQLKDKSAQQEFVFTQLQQQATELGQAAAAMPTRVAAISDTIDQITAGDLKLRVRVLEGERAARRGAVLQLTTMQTVAGVGLLNVGTQLALAGHEGPGSACFAAAGAFGVFVLLGLRRVQRLDKFEKDLRNGR